MATRRQTLITRVIMGAGAALTMSGVLEDGRVDATDLRSVGAVIVLTGIALVLTQHMSKPFDASYELGRSDGYREGYDDGRKIGRPTVVKLNSRCCGSCARTDGAPVASDSHHS